jgi:hypothetical protein
MGAPLGLAIDDDTYGRLSALVQRAGVKGAAEQLGVSRNALLQALARQGVRRGTLALLERGLGTEAACR